MLNYPYYLVFFLTGVLPVYYCIFMLNTDYGVIQLYITFFFDYWKERINGYMEIEKESLS